MKPTRADLSYWQAKTLPQWAREHIKTQDAASLLDAAVNSHSKTRLPHYTAAWNTIALMPLRRSNALREGVEMSDSDCLRSLVESKCRIRQHYAKRWLAKIEKNKSN